MNYKKILINIGEFLTRIYYAAFQLIILFLLLSSFLLLFKVPKATAVLGEGYDEWGFRKNKTYLQFSPSEFVNVFSGSLVLNHTDIYLPGNGGLDLKIQRSYNSKIFQELTDTTYSIACWTYGELGVGWDMHFGRISDLGLGPGQLYGLNPFFMQMPDGSVHPIYYNDHSNINTSVSSQFVTEDFWLINYDETNDRYIMTLPDGTVYTLANRVADAGISYSFYYVTSIKDKNENEINIEYHDCCDIDPDDVLNSGNLGSCPEQTTYFNRTRHVKRIIDSTGRIINFNMKNNSCRGNAISSIEVNGDSYNYIYSPTTENGDECTFYDGGSQALLLQVQPPVGPGWNYLYDVDPNDGEPDGELIEITYPSGAKVNYDYETIDLDVFTDGGVMISDKFRVVKSRTTLGPDIASGTWDFDYDPTNLEDIRMVTDSCGNKEEYRFFGGKENSFNSVWDVGILKDKTIKNTNDVVFERQVNNWDSFQYSNNVYDPVTIISGAFLPRLNSRTISRGVNDYTTSFNYNRFYDSPTQIIEDGELDRTTIISYFEDLSGNVQQGLIFGKPENISTSDSSETLVVSNSYDIKGNVTSVNEYGVITDFGYYPDGNLHWEKNARGYYTHFEDYQYGVPGTTLLGSSNNQATDPTYIESRDINWEGTLSVFRDGRSNQTSYQYDSLNRVTSITPPPSGEAITTIEYDNISDLYKTYRKGDNFLQTFNDGFGRTIRTQNSSGVQTEVQYDQCGRKSFVSLPYDGSTSITGDSFSYDPLGRITQIIRPGGDTVDFNYTTTNNVTINNENDLDRVFIYKSFGDLDDKRLINVTEPNNQTTTYSYDLFGNIRSINSPQGINRTFDYNSKNLLISESQPESGTTEYTHDQIGNVVSKTDANYITIGYTYDKINRLISTDHPAPDEDETYTYDNANNRISMQGSLGTYSYLFNYDSSNRLISQDVTVDGVGYSIDYTYDDKNNLTQIIYPSGETRNMTYDASNRLFDIQGFILDMFYHPSGALKHIDNMIGVLSNFSFDNRHRIDNIKVSRVFPYIEIKRQGTGDGTITSNPLAIDCGTDCAVYGLIEGTELTFTVTPNPGSIFTGWSGDPDCTDSIVTASGTKTCIANFLLSNQYTLSVTKTGTGTGTVTSNPVGIDCGSTCSSDFDEDSDVTLNAVPDTGSTFSGWSGDADCTDGSVTMNGDKSCTATFNSGFDLTITKSGLGSGTVTSSPAGIDCGSTCTANFATDITVTLNPVPAAGSTFVGWLGDPDCSDGLVTMDAAKSCEAVFGRLYTLTILKSGTGTGLIKTFLDAQFGINCGSDCTEDYLEDTILGFEIIPDPGSSFTGWSGTLGCPTSPNGGVIMDKDLTCTATFNQLPGTVLSIFKDGDGFGTVTSSPAGINCGSDCGETYNNRTVVTLTPTGNAGSIFADWAGDPDCSDGVVTMDVSKSCTATFNTSTETRRLNIDIDGNGDVYTSFPYSGNIDCTYVENFGHTSSKCNFDFSINSVVPLNKRILAPCPPGFNEVCVYINDQSRDLEYTSKFLRLEGDPDCSDGEVRMDSDKTCRAIFTPIRLDLNWSSGGNVAYSPTGVDCGPDFDCTLLYNLNSQVTMVPTPNSGSYFAGWSGDADCIDNIVTMNQIKSCNANYLPVPADHYAVTVMKSGAGSGNVTTTPSGIDCGSDCSEAFPMDTQITITPVADLGSVFTGWTGAPDCAGGVLYMDSNKTCTANFGIDITSPIAYVTDITGGTISAVNTEDNLLLSSSSNVGNGPRYSAISPDNLTLYVSNSNDDTVTVLDAQDLSVLTNISVGDNPRNLVLSDDGLKLYVPNFSDNTVSVIDSSSNAVIDTIPVGSGPWFSDISPDNAKVYVGNSSGNTISIIDTSSNSVVNTITVGTPPFGVVVNNSNTRVYVVNKDDSTISVIDTGNDMVVDTVTGLDVEPRIVEVSLDDSSLFVGYQNVATLTEIDTTTNTISDTKTLSSRAIDLKVHPNNSQILYIAFFDEDVLGVYNIATGLVDATIGVGDGPIGIAISTGTGNTGIQHTLAATKDGTGTGTVTSSPTGIDCGATCNADFDENTFVTLVATPAGNSLFTGWSGDADCIDGVVRIDSAKSCNATFSKPDFNLSVNKNGNGSGTVTSSPAGIDCGSDCAEDYVVDTTVDLSAVPNADSNFAGWSGDEDCSDGVLTLNSDINCTAIFNLKIYTLNITTTGTGSGLVTSSPAGINCGTDCDEQYDINTSVNLTVIPDAGSIFDGWTGDVDCSDGIVSIDGDKSCIATFSQSSQLYNLTVEKSGNGEGTLTTFPSGILCGTECSHDFLVNSTVEVIPNPDDTSSLSGWQPGTDCVQELGSQSSHIQMDSDKYCIRIFGAECDCNDPNAILGTSGNDTLNGTNGNDIICGFDGNDTINGRSGDDCIFGGNGNDDIDGGRGIDSIYGQGGDDIITGKSDSNYIDGGKGNDNVDGGRDGSQCVLAETVSNCNTISNFERNLSISKAGNGDGLVTSIPEGINCGSDCNEVYTPYNTVILTVDPDIGSIFTGWSGDTECSDGIVPMNLALNFTCIANFDSAPVQQFSLSVNKAGTGSGTVSSSPIGIDCGADCTEDYNENSSVTLTPTSDAGSVFVGWTGDADCSDGIVLMDAAKSCTATFDISSGQQFTLTLNSSGTGSGTVTSNPSGIDCGSDCTELYDENTSVTLTPTPDSGSAFTGWSGDADCSDGNVLMDTDKTCTAIFDLKSTDPCDCNDPSAILGTSGNDTLTGSNRADIICGFDGDDVLNGGGGNDCIFGGAGDDTILGGNGHDNLYGGDDNDNITGDKGNDLLDGGDGIDNLDGGNNNDTCLNGETTSNCESFSKAGFQLQIHNINEISVEVVEVNETSSCTDSGFVLAGLKENEKSVAVKRGPPSKLNQYLSGLSTYSPESELPEEDLIAKEANNSSILYLSALNNLLSLSITQQTMGDPVPFIDLQYSYDGVGNITSIQDSMDANNSITMQYDSLDRLTTANGPWQNGSFTYDALGNRTSSVTGTNTATYDYDPVTNRMEGLTYDNNGNITFDGFFTYTYDSENRLIGITNGTDVITYKYDGDGRRISQTVNGEKTVYAYGTGLNVLTEFTESGIPKVDYIYAGTRTVAREEFDESGNPVKKTFYHTDHLGSTKAITNLESTEIWKQGYLPYGGSYNNEVNPYEQITNTHQYTGKEVEGMVGEEGTYYYGARYYRPDLGRFMSTDPGPMDITNPQSFNRYSYVNNNPFSFVDPDGEEAIKVSLKSFTEFNKGIRNNLGFVPGFILDIILPDDIESAKSALESGLPGPQAIGVSVLSKGASKVSFVTHDRFDGVKGLSLILRNVGLTRKKRLEIINSFSKGTILRKTATGNENLLRYSGGLAKQKGRFLTPSFPIFGSARDILSLPPENLGTELSQFRLRKGATFFEGTVAPKFNKPGGGVQYFVPNINDLVP